MIKATIKQSEQIKAGSYIARCYSMIHIGTVSFEYLGQISTSNKFRITFEIPSLKKVFKEGDEAKPVVISRELSTSLGKKSKTRPLLESWRGKAFTDEEAKDFDFTELLGVPAMISIVHNEKGYADISSIMKLPEGMECPAQINPTQVLSYDAWDENLFQKLPEFIRKKIEISVEYKNMKGITPQVDEFDMDTTGEEIAPF